MIEDKPALQQNRERKMRCNGRCSDWNAKQEQGRQCYCQKSIFASFYTGFILNNFILWRGEPAGSNHSLN